MKMNRAETFAMNSFIRTLFLRYLEAPLLKGLGGNIKGKKVLEIGCGQGIGTEILIEFFGAGHVTALDLDPAMVERARKRLASYSPDQLAVRVGDVNKIESENASYDAVVDFAALHHVPDWQSAVGEIARVLKSEGSFLFEEVTRQWITR